MFEAPVQLRLFMADPDELLQLFIVQQYYAYFKRPPC